jgi:hypothetical protein
LHIYIDETSKEITLAIHSACQSGVIGPGGMAMVRVRDFFRFGSVTDEAGA